MRVGLASSVTRLSAFALTVLCAACTSSTGSGIGEARDGGADVRFTWEAQGAIKGQMSAELEDGQTYSGQLFQITSDTRVDDVGPLWLGWDRRWGGWDHWGAGPEFITTYSGCVLANLTNPVGDHMRCKIRLVQPARGMSGGGEGSCQLADGSTVDATFPAG